MARGSWRFGPGTSNRVPGFGVAYHLSLLEQVALLSAPTCSNILASRFLRRHTNKQEVLHNQIDDLQTLLGSSWDHVGVGRDDGKQAGEYSPIYYDASQWVVLDWATKWLSKTPDVPASKSWDAVSLCFLSRFAL